MSLSSFALRPKEGLFHKSGSCSTGKEEQSCSKKIMDMKHEWEKELLKIFEILELFVSAA